jgi:hypothetical protein
VEALVRVDVRKSNRESDGFAVGRELGIGDPMDLQQRGRVEGFLLRQKEIWKQGEGQPRDTAHIHKIISHVSASRE